MGLFSFLYELTKPSKKKINNNDDELNWETHCESCGELLEDCECDWQEQSKQDINQEYLDDLDFDEMNDVWDEEDNLL